MVAGELLNLGKERLELGVSKITCKPSHVFPKQSLHHYMQPTILLARSWSQASMPDIVTYLEGCYCLQRGGSSAMDQMSN